MGCVKSKEADIQDKVIKTELEPGLQLGRYVKDPTADNKHVSGSRRAPAGGGLRALEPPVRALELREHRAWGWPRALGWEHRVWWK